MEILSLSIPYLIGTLGFLHAQYLTLLFCRKLQGLRHCLGLVWTIQMIQMMKLPTDLKLRNNLKDLKAQK